MPKSRDSRLIPSTGVLLAAIGAAVLAAILINVYVSRVEQRFWAGSMIVYRLRENINEGDPLRERHIEPVRIAKVHEEAFKPALDPENKDNALGKLAPRKMLKGEYLWSRDFLTTDPTELAVDVGQGKELLAIPVSGDQSLGRQLKVGDYVKLRADFYDDPKEKKSSVTPMVVMRNVKVSAIGDSTAPATTGRRASYDSIQVQLDEEQANRLVEIQEVMAGKRFVVTRMSRPEGVIEPEFSDEIQKYMARLKTPGADVFLD